MDRSNRRCIKHYTAIILTIAMIFGQIAPVSAAAEINGYSLLEEDDSVTAESITEEDVISELSDTFEGLIDDKPEVLQDELIIEEENTLDNGMILSEDSILDEEGSLSEDVVEYELLTDGLEEALDGIDIDGTGAEYAVNYSINATQDDFVNYPGVYLATAKKDTSGQMEIGIPSLAKQNAEPTNESPAIIMGAAMPYERKTGPTEYTPITGGSLYSPYSKFRYQIIEEANLNGTGGTHRKMSGFDGTYLIIRLDVKALIDGQPDGNYLHMKQTHNKAMMVKIGQEASNGMVAFSDAMGNATASYLISGNKLVARDSEGKYKDVSYIDIIFLSSGTLVQGADTGSATPDPKAPQADFPVSFYVDNTEDYNPDIEWNSSLGTAVNKETGQAVTVPTGTTASDMILNKFYDDSKAGSPYKYLIKGSDVELEMMVESTAERPTGTGKTEYWSLKSGMEDTRYNDRPIKLICEAPLLTSLNVKGNSSRHVILDVNSFDIQLANHSDTNAAALVVDGGKLTIQDTFNTTGAELAVGNNAKMEIKNNGRLVITDSAQLEIEYDAASVSQGSASSPTYNNGVINVNTGGVIENHGIISVEGKEGKPQNAGDVVVRDYKNAKMTIDNGGTLENYGCLLVNGEFYNLGTVKNFGKYDETITSNDPDKGTFTYHKGIQLSWKDDITQGHTFAGEMYNGVNDNGTVYNTAKLENTGDIVMVPGYLENKGTITNNGNIYMCAVDEVVIPITALADQPLVTEQRVRLGYFEDSVFVNDHTITNSGKISPAKVEIISNGRTGNLTPNVSDDPENLNIRGFGSVTNSGTININAIYAFSTITNKGEGTINKVFLCRESNYSGKLTDSSSQKTTVYNGAKTVSGKTFTWTFTGLDSLSLANRVIKEPVQAGETVKWKFRADTSNTGKEIKFLVNAMLVSPYEKITSIEIPANKDVEIESPRLPDINGNAVYYFYAEANSDADGAAESASVKVKGSGFIKPTAIQNLVYNGQQQELVTQGSYEDGTLEYRLAGGPFSTSVPTAKNAGIYTVEWQKKKNGNVDGNGTLTVNIARREAYIAADDKARKKGMEQAALTYVTYGILDGDDFGITTNVIGFDKEVAAEYLIKVTYNEARKSNYDVTVYDGTYTVIGTESLEAPEINVQAVLGGFDNVASTASINVVYKPTDKSRKAVMYYSLSENLTKDNFKTKGTTVVPTYGGIGEQKMYYYVDTPDGGAGGSKTIVKIKADQKAPDKNKFNVEQAIKGMGVYISGNEARKTEYRRADQDSYTMAYSEYVEGFRGTYYIRYAGDGVRYNPSPDIKVEMPPEKTVTAIFDSNGGNYYDAKIFGLIFGDTLTKPAIDPVRDGYKFVCWCFDKNCTKEYDFGRFVTEADENNNIRIYAKWARIIPDATDDDSDAIRKDIGDDSNLSINKTTKGTVSIDTVTVSGSKISEVRTDEDGKVTVTSQIWVGGLLNSYTYSGLAIKPEIRVYDGVKKLTEKVDYTLSYRNNKNAAAVGAKNAKGKSIAPTVIIKFKGNYQGNASRDVEFNIVKAKLGDGEDADVAVQDMSVVALKNNKPQKPVPVITMKSTGKALNAKLFNITYSPTVSSAGIYKVTVKPKNSNFAGQATANITVVSDKNLMLGKASVSIKPNSYVYTGKEVIPADSAIILKIGRTVLRPQVDYKVKAIYNNVEPGTATIVFEPVEGSKYAGTKTATFKIKKGRVFNSFTKSDFKYMYEDSVPYAKGGAKPEVRIYDRGILLKEKVDYTVTYKNNRAVRNKNATNKGKDISPQIIVKGKGKYKGSIRLPYGITQQSISKLNIIAADQFLDMSQYKTKYKKAKITITDLDGKKLGSKDFTVTGTPKFAGIVSKNNVMVTISVNGIGNYKGTENVTFRLIDKTKNIANAKVMNKIAAQEYTGNEITLSRNDLKNILYTGKKSAPSYLKYNNDPQNDDFEIIGYTNNIKKGTAKLTVRDINKFAGTKTLTFKIVRKNAEYRGALIDGRWRK